MTVTETKCLIDVESIRGDFSQIQRGASYFISNKTTTLKDWF